MKKIHIVAEFRPLNQAIGFIRRATMRIAFISEGVVATLIRTPYAMVQKHSYDITQRLKTIKTSKEVN